MEAATVTSEMKKALRALGYPPPLEHVRVYGQESVLQAVDTVGFGSEVISPKSACIAGHYCPSPDDGDRIIHAVAQAGVRYAYLGHVNGAGRLYGIGPGDDPDSLRAEVIDGVGVGDAVNYFLAHAERFAPEQVLQEKLRVLPEERRHVEPWQLSFATMGLLDFQEEQTEGSLVKLLETSVAVAVAAWEREGGVPENAHAIVGRVFLRLVAACALAHKRITRVDPAEREATIQAARTLLPTFMDRDTLKEVPQSICEMLWARLQDVRFELLTSDTLAGVYPRILLSDEERRRHGIYYTPRSVRRFLWNQAAELLRHFPADERIVVDPTCGSGGFLLSAYEGLARLEGVNLVVPHDVDGFRWRILGADQDPIACDIARLSLILESQPTTNDWCISAKRFQDWVPAPLQRPRLVIGNPPFGQQQAVDVLLRSLDWVVPGGIVALVMPRAFLTNVDAQEAREAAVRRGELLAVTELPERVFPGSQASTCTVTMCRRVPPHSNAGERFTFRPLALPLVPEEQRRRFALGDPSFAAPAQPLPVGDFVAGAAGLASVWDVVRAPLYARDVMDVRRGVQLRGKKDDPVQVEITDVPEPGYLPYLGDAKHHVVPFRITQVRYLEWVPERMYRPCRVEHWNPGKVVLCRHITHKQRRWRLIAAVDHTGVAYGNRVLGCYPKDRDWSPESILCFLASSYANAWYATHSTQGYVVREILDAMPVPQFGEDDLEHLTALGTALGACADDHASDLSALDDYTYAYVMGALLQAVDRVVCNAAGLSVGHQAAIDEYLSEVDKPRPGLPPLPETGETYLVHEGKLTGLLTTTGLVLAVDTDCDIAILWLDNLDLRVPICVPARWLPDEARTPARAIEALASLDARSLQDMELARVRFFPEGHVPRHQLGEELAALASR